MLWKLTYFSNEENHTSASSDGSLRNADGANEVSMISGIAGGGTTGGADDDGDEVEVLGVDITGTAVFTVTAAVVVAGVAVAAADDAGVGSSAADGCDGNWNTLAAAGAEKEADTDGDDGDWNSGATYSSEADERVDSAGGFEKGIVLRPRHSCWFLVTMYKSPVEFLLSGHNRRCGCCRR